MSDDRTGGDGYTFGDVSVVMGTYNEREAIATVLADIDAVTDEQAEVVCIDSSSDGTADVAREHGARVIEQEPQGYGVAVHEAITTPDRPVIVTTDCDDTYPMERLPDFLDAINDGYDVVSGDRLSGGAETMPWFNRQGNHAFAWLASALVGERVHDTTTGMRAYRREVIEAIEWTENTGLSAELLVRPLLRGYRVTEIPIEYRERVGETTLNPVTGGAAIAKSVVSVSLAERFGRGSSTERPGPNRATE
ncbi:dolichyl-phosphate hexose transferase [Halorhabdus salina]|uniref:dolichyl-phosphate hexose transferase n=1 Tax=Halorhabdus salina TaxID=2750670 RepID=UPI0015EF365F|nr:dolichyl-phosphate hexose transferase [Halorhabdus salina]